jgi:5'-nucleotidase
MNFLLRPWPARVVLLLVTLAGGLWLTWAAFNYPRRATTADIRVTLVHLNDVYEITALDGGRSGGLARVATFARQLRKENRHTYVLHAGDFLSPSVLGGARLDGNKRLAGKQMVAVLQASGVDYITFGNHEFDLTKDEFVERLQELTGQPGDRQGPTLFSTNVRDTEGYPLPSVPRSQVLTIADSPSQRVPLRIGLLGLTMTVQSKYATFVDPIKAAKEDLRRWASGREKPDSVIALTHQPLEDDEALARAVPGIDLILGGHEHENAHSQPLGPVQAPAISLPSIYRADANARTVYVHELFYDPQTRRLRRVHSRLEPITNAIPEDPDVAAVAQRYDEEARAALKKDDLDPDQELGSVTTTLDGREKEIRKRSTRLTELVAEAMLYALRDVEGPRVAIYNAGSIRIDDRIPPGPIKMYEVLRMLPFGDKLMRVQMKGDLLKRILDRADQGRGTGAFLQTGNVRPQGEGANRVWSVADHPLDPAVTYQVAMSDYLLTGREKGFEFLGPPNSPVKGNTIADWRKVVREYLLSVKRWPQPKGKAEGG